MINKNHLVIGIIILLTSAILLQEYELSLVEPKIQESHLTGLIEGFDNGFSNGTQFGIGETIGATDISQK